MNNAPHTITILPGQSLPDIALQEYGTVEGMVFILEANPGLSLGSELTPGTEIIIPGRAVVTTPGKSAPAPEPVQAVQSITIYQDAAPAAKPAKAYKTITVQAGQTLADIAMQEYHTFEAAILLLQANPGLSITGPLEPGQQLVVFTNYTIKLVQELVKVEPFASQLQNLLAQWAALVRPEPGVVTETDPVFTSWLATFEPFSGNYADLAGKPAIPAAQVQSDYTQADSAQVDYIKNKPQTKQAALTDNSDFPQSHVGQALKILRERADETGVEFFTPTWISAITKAMVESVLTGVITTHTHDYAPADIVQVIELLFEFKFGYGIYKENVFTGSDLTQVNYWSSAAKTLKLFTKTITYTSGNPTTIVLKDEVTGKLLTTSIAYTGSEVLNVTKVVS